MEETIEQGILYNFYGELLTEHQRQIYEGVVPSDLSLNEIAREQGISRQGVRDLIKRCDKVLAGYEEGLQFIHKFNKTKQKVTDTRQPAKQHQEAEDVNLLKRIEEVAGGVVGL